MAGLFRRQLFPQSQDLGLASVELLHLCSELRLPGVEFDGSRGQLGLMVPNFCLTFCQRFFRGHRG